MKRILIVCAILLLPAAVFAQVQVGATALYNFPYFADPGVPSLDASDFTFGADARIRVFLFQASALALFTPGNTEVGFEAPASIDLIVDGGLSFDVLLFRLGVGLGPSLRFNLEPGTDATGIGLNVKATADVVLGGISVGFSYLNQFEFDFADVNQVLDQDYTKGLLGVSVLFEL